MISYSAQNQINLPMVFAPAWRSSRSSTSRSSCGNGSQRKKHKCECVHGDKIEFCWVVSWDFLESCQIELMRNQEISSVYIVYVIQCSFLATITIMQQNSYTNPHPLNIERKLLLWLCKSIVKSCNRSISFLCYVIFSLYLSIFRVRTRCSVAWFTRWQRHFIVPLVTTQSS